jgi:hypothetical protein
MSALAGMLDESPAQASLSLEEALAETAELTMAGQPSAAASENDAAIAPQNELASDLSYTSSSAPLAEPSPNANHPDAAPANTGHGQENTPT